MRGKFITFEGPEGGGKSTQVQALADWLRKQGKTVVVTREPGGTRLAELIRGLVRDEMDDPPVTRCEVLLFLASRAQVVSQVIRPALARGDWVVCDRFSDSTFAYQGYGRGIDVQLLKNFNDFVTEVVKPIFLSVKVGNSSVHIKVDFSFSNSFHIVYLSFITVTKLYHTLINLSIEKF